MHPSNCVCADCRGVTRTGMDRHVECYGGPFDGARFRVESLAPYLNLPADMPAPYKVQSKFAEALERLGSGREYVYVRVDSESLPGVTVMRRNGSGRVMYRMLGMDLGLGEKS